MDEPKAGAKLTGLEAEGAGFEPAVQGYRTPVFKTGAFDHSATPPRGIVAGAAPWRRETQPELQSEFTGRVIYSRRKGRTR